MNIDKYISKNKSFINGILITMLIGIVVNILNYLFNIFLARNLTDTDFGFYNAAIGIITLAQIPTIAIQTALTKKVAQNKKVNLKKFKTRSTLQLLIIAISISILFYLLGNYISYVASIPQGYILPLTLVVFGAIFTPIIKGFLLGLEKILSFNLILLFETLLKFLIAIIGIDFDIGITPPILACVLPSLITFLVIFPLIKTKSEKKPKKDIKLNYKTITLTFLTFLLLNVPFTLDLILVNQDVRASYGALSLVGKITYFASIMIATVMISKLANSKEKDKKRNLLISLLISALTGIGISLLILLFKEGIVSIMFDGKYTEIVNYVFPYSLAMTVYALSYMMITSLLVDDSYVHIYFLIFISVLQATLFRMNNYTLHNVFINQIVIYSALSVFTVIILFFYIQKRNGEKEEKEIKQGS